VTDRPLVGITSYLEDATWGVWQQPAALVPQLYVDAVTAAGGVPVLLPPQPVGEPKRLLDRLDGLVLAGGPDVDPARYRQQPHPRTGAPRPGRDDWELALTRTALDLDLPLLGVCRGLQILNTALGGTLVQHLPERTGERTRHRPAPGGLERRRHGGGRGAARSPVRRGRPVASRGRPRRPAPVRRLRPRP
jgi:gamma-glutamyl-gamma-aminobutyrate hydrolase PuuD